MHYRNHYFQSSKGHNSKRRLIRVTVLVFCISFHDVLHLCEGSTKYLEHFQLKEWTKYIAEMAIFNIFYVQRAATPKVD